VVAKSCGKSELAWREGRPIRRQRPTLMRSVLSLHPLPSLT
jgi:hypothetical protein